MCFSVMNDIQIREEVKNEISHFELPSYTEIPNIGLFLEQTTKFVSEYLKPLRCISITGSMISNYVKKKIIDNPVKKQYYREQIADVIFIAIVKSVLSLEEAQKLLEIQRRDYDSQVAYEYFCNELKNVLSYVFGLSKDLPEFDDSAPIEKELLRKVIIAASYKVFLYEAFEEIK